MITADFLIMLFEDEGMKIPDRKRLHKELSEAIDEERIYNFCDGDIWQGFLTWMIEDIEGKKCITISNLLIFKPYRKKVNLHKIPRLLKRIYPAMPIIWRNRKRERIFITQGGKNA